MRKRRADPCVFQMSMDSDQAALYIHVPFCRGICGYCDFQRVLYRPALAGGWLDHIVRDISAVRSQASTIYVGGGTPTALSDEELERLLKAIKPFVHGQEYTVEANPESVTPDKAELLARYGVNRVSLGVQSFDEQLLRILERVHRPHQIEYAINCLIDAGINNLSIDLMYSLPQQTMPQWKNDLEHAVRLPVTHISLYSLTIEPGSRFAREGKRPLDNDTEYEMYRYAIDFLNAHGFQQYEISNFARKGKQSRHNLSYWHYDDWIGIGPGASGKQKDERYTHTSTVQEYACGEDQREVVALSEEDKRFEAVMMGLRCNEGIDRKRYRQRYGVDLVDHYRDAVEQNAARGNLVVSDQTVRASDQGRFILNDVLEDFLD